MVEYRQQPTGRGQRLKTGLFWLIVILIPVLVIEAWSFAIARFGVALVVVAIVSRLVALRLEHFGGKPALMTVHMATYVIAVATWALLAGNGPLYGRPLDLLTPARLFLLPAVCWFGYEFFRQRRLRPAAGHS